MGCGNRGGAAGGRRWRHVRERRCLAWACGPACWSGLGAKSDTRAGGRADAAVLLRLRLVPAMGVGIPLLPVRALRAVFLLPSVPLRVRVGLGMETALVLRGTAWRADGLRRMAPSRS